MRQASERIAVISDVHGNLTALEAVLDHIRLAGITRIFNLGDVVGKGPRSAAVLDRCRQVCEIIVQGNWDADVANGFKKPWTAGEWHREQLGANRLAYLAALPGSADVMLSGRRVRLFHASQLSPFDRVHASGTREQHEAMFENTPFTGFGAAPDIVGYGDIHTPYVLNFNNRTLFNAGSVGNALDMPLACYCVLEGACWAETASPWALHFVRVPYDIEGEIAVAEACAMPDGQYYASELRTARYRGRTPLVPETEQA